MVYLLSKNPNLGIFLEGLGMENVGVFHGLWEYFRQIGIFYARLVYYVSFGITFPVLVVTLKIWQPWLVMSYAICCAAISCIATHDSGLASGSNMHLQLDMYKCMYLHLCLVG
jgi:hypothetical protein